MVSTPSSDSVHVRLFPQVPEYSALTAIETAKRASFNVIGIEDECSALPSNEVAKMCDYFLYEKDEYDLSFLD